MPAFRQINRVDWAITVSTLLTLAMALLAGTGHAATVAVGLPVLA